MIIFIRFGQVDGSGTQALTSSCRRCSVEFVASKIATWELSAECIIKQLQMHPSEDGKVAVEAQCTPQYMAS